MDRFTKLKDKKTENEANLPDGWKRVRLGEILSFRNGKSPQIVDGGMYPIYGSNGLIGFTNDYFLNGVFLLVGRVGASGETHLVSGKVWASDNCLIGECKSDTTPVFIYYLLKYLDLKKFITQTAQPLITQSFVNNLQIILPPLPEQHKIAEILETIDNAIEKTDRIIEKYKRIKQGLMQDLLTRGIVESDELGVMSYELRDEKKHRFKDSPLGRIPEEWEIKKDFIKIFSGYGFALKEYSEDGIFLIRIDNIGHGRLIHENFAYLPEKYKHLYERFLIKRGDILLALNRPITREKLKIAKVDLDNAILYQRVGKLLFRNEIEKNFYFYYMQSNFFIKQLEISLVGSDQPYITDTDFKDLLFKFPPLLEQHRIASILSQIDEAIEKEKKYKEKLERIKRGLMEDLLTGNVRVNHLIEEVET